jgi:5-methylcytosine-specific restriction endonuclease McrA
MPKSPSWAKNVAKQVLWTAIDRELKDHEIDLLWAYFSDGCAYCGSVLTRGGNGAHKDHVVPVESGGTNHISNRVLACARCNEKEKRDEDWNSFLRKKAGEDAVFERRKKKIEDWKRQHADSLVPLSASVRQTWKEEKERLAREFDISLARMKEAKNG